MKSHSGFFTKSAGARVGRTFLAALVLAGSHCAAQLTGHPQSASTSTGPVPALESLPGAAGAGLIYLDFDGETIQDPKWNNNQPIVAAASGFSTDQIRQAYEAMKEDFLPFNVNVTTIRERYGDRDNWSRPKRMRVIFTPTDEWYYLWQQQEFPSDPDAWYPGRGRAHGGSFINSGPGLAHSSTVPCFVFISDFNNGAPAITGLEAGGHGSHEVGHTMGLVHEGWRRPNGSVALYHFGCGQGPGAVIHGSQETVMKLWSPIMGGPETGLLSQWCPGGIPWGTPGDDGSQGPRNYWGQVFSDDIQRPWGNGVIVPDDIAVLGATGSGTNDFGLRTTEPDGSSDHSGTTAGATGLTISAQGTFAATGLIGRTPSGAADVDCFRLQLPAPATITAVVKPAEPFATADAAADRRLNAGIPNLYMNVELIRSNGSHASWFTSGSSTAYNPAAPTEKGSVATIEFLRRHLASAPADTGTYYIAVSSSGYGNPLLPPTADADGFPVPSVGFMADGSMGAYSISGSVDWIEPQITSALQWSGTVSEAFSYTATSSLAGVTWSATGLPQGLSMNSGSGLISGSPAAGGTFSVTLRASTARAFGEAVLVLTIGTPAAPTIVSPLSITAEEGQPLSATIVATGNPTSYGVAGGIVGGLSVHPTTGVISGIPTMPGVTSVTVTATNAWGTGQRSIEFTVRPSPQTALDSPLAFTRTGPMSWFGQMNVVSDGMDAMQSPALGDSQSASIETTVTGPGTIEYWWRTDTEPGDVLSLQVGAVTVDSVSGSNGWIPRSQSVPAGVQTLRWTFARNASGSGGSNTVWLDRVRWSAATGPTITSPLSVNWTCGQLSLVYLTSDDPATVWTMSGTLPEGVFFIGDPTNLIGATPWRPGTFTVTLFATNSLGTTTRAFNMQIESSYSAWARNNGLAPGSEGADPDKDGLTNFAEVAFALNPTVPNGPYQPVTFDPATKRLRAVFNRRTQYFPDIKYEVQVSENLQTWMTIAEVTNGSSVTSLGAHSTSEIQIQPHPDPIVQVTVVDGVAQTPAKPRRWMRVKVSQMR